MPRTSLYLDRICCKKAYGNARKVTKNQVNDEWPEGYFDIMGTVDDDSFQAPDDVPSTQVTAMEVDDASPEVQYNDVHDECSSFREQQNGRKYEK